MSHTNPIATSSSNFQQVFSDALKEYERYTKQDLLAHPLAAQLQACDSPNSIILVLQQQVQGRDQSQTSDDRLTKWLVPMVNVLYAFSTTLGEGIGLVCSVTRTCNICTIKCILQVFSPANVIFTGVGVLLSVCILPNVFTWTVLLIKSHR